MNWTEEQLAELERTRASGLGVVRVPGGTYFDGPSMASPPFHCPADPELEPVTVSLLGDPQGKGRARAFLRGGHIGHYTPEKTRSYESMIRGAATEALGKRLAFDRPVEFTLRAIFPVPASWSGKKQQQALLGIIKPGKKPDLDNIAKAWNDAMNGVVYRDDSLIVRMTLDKRYGPQALVVATVRPA